MPSASNLSWLYHLLGYSLAAAGLLLLLWSLFYDRSRGRRRCPKCWYDMSGTPGLGCPECGKAVPAERRLFRTRRRPRLAAAATLPIVLAPAVFVLPGILRGNWRTSAPTLALIAVAEVQGWPQPPQMSGNTVCGELINRRPTMKGWTLDVVSRNMIRWSFRYRPVWPKRIPLAVKCGGPFWYGESTRGMRLSAKLAQTESGKSDWAVLEPFGGGVNCGAVWWDDDYTLLGLPKSGPASMTVLFCTAPQGYWRSQIDPSTPPSWSRTFPIRLVDSVDEVIPPIQSPAIESELRNSFGIVDEHYCGQGVRIRLSGSARAAGIAVGIRVEVYHNGHLAGVASGWDAGEAWANLSTPRQLILPLEIQSTERIPFPATDHSWSVTIRSDPALALRDFQATSYWAGTIAFSLKDPGTPIVPPTVSTSDPTASPGAATDDRTFLDPLFKPR